MKGLFVAFEGPDGSGKTYMAKMAAEHLKNTGHNVVEVREPQGEIRKILLDPDGNLHPLTELLLYISDRAQVVQTIIKPALEAGAIVIGDRHALSTEVYQGAVKGHDIDLIKGLNAIATTGITPDLTILLDVDTKTGIARNTAHGKDDRFERESIAFKENVRQAYLNLGAGRQRTCTIDASGQPDEVFGKIKEALTGLLNMPCRQRTESKG